jgi:hypothetical protein
MPVQDTERMVGMAAEYLYMLMGGTPGKPEALSPISIHTNLRHLVEYHHSKYPEANCYKS